MQPVDPQPKPVAPGDQLVSDGGGGSSYQPSFKPLLTSDDIAFVIDGASYDGNRVPKTLTHAVNYLKNDQMTDRQAYQAAITVMQNAHQQAIAALQNDMEAKVATQIQAVRAQLEADAKKKQEAWKAAYAALAALNT